MTHHKSREVRRAVALAAGHLSLARRRGSPRRIVSRRAACALWSVAAMAMWSASPTFAGGSSGSCDCDGGVTYLELRYNGANGALVSVDDGGTIIFIDTLNDNDTFALIGGSANGRFLTNNLILSVDGSNTSIHVSCSQPIDVGTVFGPFTVLNFASRNLGFCLPPCPGGGNPPGGTSVDLSKDGQGEQCIASLRPTTSSGGVAAFVMTARTSVDQASPLDPTASGSVGSVDIREHGAGVKRADCDGEKGIRGKDSDRDEELIFTFDTPVDSACLTMGFDKIKLDTSSSAQGSDVIGAEAGQDQTAAIGAVVTLDATASFGPGGTGLTYQWSQVAGPAAVISSPNTAITDFVAPVVTAPTSLQFYLEVQSGALGAFDSVVITVNPPTPGNTVPVAYAGPEQVGNELTAIVLAADGSTDADGDALSYTWTQVSGPTAIMFDVNTARPQFLIPDIRRDEQLVFRVRAFDGQAASTSTTSIIAHPNYDEPVLFVSTTAASGYDVVIPTSAIVSAFVASGSDEGSLTFSDLLALPAGTQIDAFKIRETRDYFYVASLDFTCHCAVDSDCDDGDGCNGVETCDPICGCQPGVPLVCDDGNVCNGVETCDPVGGCMAGTPNPGGPCDDDDLCNGREVCDGNGVCQAGSPLVCDDGNACNGLELCDSIGGCQAGVPTNCPPVDVVFVMDTSGSMQNEGEALCSKITGVVADLATQGVVVDATILAIHPNSTSNLFSCQSSGDTVTALFGDAVPGDPDGCPGDLTGNNSTEKDENWGPATAIVAERFPWTFGATRVIVPISDEGACLGSSGNGCNDPGSDRDAVTNAINTAIAFDVVVSPITGDGSSGCVIGLAQDLAAGTGGIAFASTNPSSDISGAIAALILSACQSADQCDDGDSCTVNDTCSSTICSGTPRDCSALTDQCNVGVCSALTGMCEAQPTPGAVCDDGDACSTADACDANGVCGGSPVVCDDGDPCTGIETCDSISGCVAGTPTDCSSLDGQCVVGVCDSGTGACGTQPANEGFTCNDGEACTVGDVCTVGVCGGASTDCSSLTDQCNVGVCNSTSGQCEAQPANNGGTCDDGNGCSVADVCSGGSCGGSAKDCSALDDQCHVGVCNATTGLCEAANANEGGACTDGDPCTVADACVMGTCVGGAKDCSALNDDCNAGVCNAGTGVCETTPSNDTGSCNDGDACTENDTCLGGSCAGMAKDCSFLNDQCNVGVCLAISGVCAASPANENQACDDGEFCTVSETCVAGLCGGGTLRDCADAVVCTVDSCDEMNDVCVNMPDDSACTNGLFCDGQESCNPTLGCQDSADPCQAPLVCDEAGDQCVDCISDAQCDDSIACTVDTCNLTTNMCEFAPNSGSCDDANTCTDDVCDPVAGCTFTANDANACTDGDLCTVNDACVAGMCVTDPKDCSAVADDCNIGVCNGLTGVCEAQPSNENGGCDDGDACTENDTCTGGSCAGSAKDCSFLNDQCLIGVCNAISGVCEAQPANTGGMCDDGDACSVGDVCSGGTCGGSPKDCSGLTDQCLLGVCNATSGVCEALPDNDGGACSDGDLCTLGDTCSGGVCGGSAKDCSGLNDQCLLGVCNAASGLCEALPDNNGGTCNDGDLCTLGDTCTAGACVGSAKDCSGLSDQCLLGVCNAGSGLCEALPDNEGGSCNDGDICSLGDTCTGGTCGGMAKDCSGLNDQCLLGVCNAVSGLCEASPDNEGGVCDDGDICTIDDVCTIGACAGPPKDCSFEDDACNVGVCNAMSGVCEKQATNDGGSCADGDPCTVNDVCSAGSCAGGPKDCSTLDGECTVGVCSAQTGDCVADPANQGLSCTDDGNECTGDLCDNGTCSHPNLTDGTGCTDDGNECTDDQCLAGVCDHPDATNGIACTTDALSCTLDVCVDGLCSHETMDDFCQDSLFCNGAEVCDPTLDCQSLGSPCIGTDVCCEAADVCEVECCADSDCPDDGLFCSGSPVCVAGMCQFSGSPCGGGSPTCCETTGTCAAQCCDDAGCSDNLAFCDGTESCVAGVCVSSGNPCDPSTPTCCEADDSCTAGMCDAIPTVSEWGMLMLTLLLLVGWKISFGRRRFADGRNSR